MRSRRWVTWLIFSICALAVLEGLGWITWKALRLERAEREARAQSEFQELIRLALWRMDSEVTPILAREAARPYFHYQPFYAAGRAYTRMLQEIRPDEVRVPSPLLDASGPYMLIHYQVGPEGQVTSPQAPTGNLRDLAESQYVDAEFIELAGERLTALASMVRPPQLRQEAPGRELAKQLGDVVQSEAPLPPPAPVQQAEQQVQAQAAQPQAQTVISEKEYQARAQLANSAQVQIDNRRGKGAEFAGKSARKDVTPPPPPSAPAATPAAAATAAPESPVDKAAPALKKLEERNRAEPDRAGGYPVVGASVRDETRAAGAKASEISVDVTEVEVSAFQPLWRSNPRTGAPELIFQRTVAIAGASLEQGIWMDWPALRDRLRAITAELLPRSELIPVAMAPNEAPTGQMLASFPVLLRPGPAPTPPRDPLVSAAHMTLGVTWLVALSGVVAIGLVLRTSMELGDRRGRFVSAVTHELRTPLTTFRLYTGMLAGGMVTDENARREYLATLEGESARLAGIVENVLDYARLGGRPARHDTPIGALDLLAQVTPSLERAALRCGLTLVQQSTTPEGVRVGADPATVERILLNLVDNACKYAGEATDRRLHLGVGLIERPIRRQFLEISIRDHGPGIPLGDRRRVFRAFHRAQRDQHGPYSGLGLGLALSRGLARELGGDLELGRADGGAEVRLIIPVTEQNT